MPHFGPRCWAAVGTALEPRGTGAIRASPPCPASSVGPDSCPPVLLAVSLPVPWLSLLLADSVPHVLAGTPQPLPHGTHAPVPGQASGAVPCWARGLSPALPGRLWAAASAGWGQGMRGSVQAAGRKPEPNNRGKWRNWKKTQRQHSQHRWFSAELRDSWEKKKGPQHAVSRGCAGQSSRPRRPWWHPSLAVPLLALGGPARPGVGGWVGGRLSPLCLPVSHADLSHALASRERDRLWSGSSGRRALPELAATGAHPLGGAPPLPPLSARDTPAAARLWPARFVPVLGICSTTPSPRTLSSCPASGHGPADKAGPGSGCSSLGECWRGWGATGCRLLELGGERGTAARCRSSGSISAATHGIHGSWTHPLSLPAAPSAPLSAPCTDDGLSSRRRGTAGP